MKVDLYDSIGGRCIGSAEYGSHSGATGPNGPIAYGLDGAQIKDKRYQGIHDGEPWWYLGMYQPWTDVSGTERYRLWAKGDL